MHHRCILDWGSPIYVGHYLCPVVRYLWRTFYDIYLRDTTNTYFCELYSYLSNKETLGIGCGPDSFGSYGRWTELTILANNYIGVRHAEAIPVPFQ